MKYLILTEGTDEKALFDVLLERKIFKYPKTDLLLEEIFHCRQLKNKPLLIDAIKLLPSKEKVSIVRIGDKLSDKF